MVSWPPVTTYVQLARTRSLLLHLTVIAVFLFALSVNSFGSEGLKLSDDAAVTVIKGMLDRRLFVGKRYTYTVECKPHSGKLSEYAYGVERPVKISFGTRELLVGSPKKGASTIPNLLTHSIQNPGEPHVTSPVIVAFWQGFDGRESRVYNRHLLTNYAGSITESHGAIRSQPILLLTTMDPLCRTLFDVQTQCFFGGATVQFSADMLASQEVVEQTHPRFGRCFQLSYKDGEIWGLVSGPPEYLLLSKKTGERPDIRVSELVSIDGVRYPAKGETNDYEARWTYELVSVESLEAPQGSWFPAWPTGTGVNDETNGKLLSVPFTVAESQAIENFQISALRQKQSGASFWSPFMILNMTLAGIVVGLFAWRYVRTKNSYR